MRIRKPVSRLTPRVAEIQNSKTRVLQLRFRSTSKEKNGGRCEREIVDSEELTSPRSRRILKLLLLILRVGEPGKQLRQLPME